ncbi:Uncharacterized membrane protein [Tranquillimonas rosea]|uniref:Uncharacterized membrane protein n=1 Tax=Tranquillimonas rosea TaxID=641238 RepID=A0A1H9R2N3_9RHOB|nr:DUF599 domain-containing protein [Tranquillimonas rosea]SER67101.1 Uncharacterized membrane protein [Tranquillimonas rosea]
MTAMDLPAFLTMLDLAALALLGGAWLAIGWWIEHPDSARPSVTVLMADYRRAWMHELVTRQPRIFDATILSSLRQGTSFFASTCVICIGGVLALMGNAERLSGVAEGLHAGDRPDLLYQLRLAPVVLFLANGFLKFVWANRLFGYCAVLMASVPNDISDKRVYPRAAQAAEINIRAARAFNRGLRSMYFSLGALAWLLGPVPLMVAAALVVLLLWWRDFASGARTVLLDPPEGH